MADRINYSVTTSHRSLSVGSYALADPDGIETRAQRVAQSVARRNGLEVLTLRNDHYDADGSGSTWQTTLGRPVGGGGAEPDADVYLHVRFTH